MHDMELPKDIKAIARAGAGVNNIPIDKCSEKGIVVFNTPGANANGVKEMVIAGLILASRDIIGGINWVQENKDDPDLLKMLKKQRNNLRVTKLKVKTWGDWTRSDRGLSCEYRNSFRYGGIGTILYFT